jgi:hypothetical protein
MEKQMMNGQAGRFALTRAQNSRIRRADDFVGPGIKGKVIRCSGCMQTEININTLCRLRGGSSSTHLVICQTGKVLNHNMLSREGEDLSELSSVEFQDGTELNEIGEGCLFRTSLKSAVIPGSVEKLGKLRFGFCENLDVADFARESQLQEIRWAAFVFSSMKLIRISRSVESLEEFAFSKSGIEVVIFESESALEKFEAFWLCES